jgi:DNA polymerase III subunit gamma/tau
VPQGSLTINKVLINAERENRPVSAISIPHWKIMSYLVLARKWRPQIFEDVIGQRATTQTLQNAISQKRVAHAFLFTGARGVGKTSTARILAKALNCEKGPQINPCNQCATCQEISSGNSMDVIEIDGASNRGIDEIRELRENVRYTPVKNRYKIIIIDEVHMLTREAFNALLKTLEEPPPHIIFIFATTEPHKIPSTILSRCQRYDFKRIRLREIVSALKKITEAEGVQVSPAGLLSISSASEGSMRDAQSLLDQVISYAGERIGDEDVAEALGLIDRKILYDTFEAIASRDGGRCMEIAEQVYHAGYDIQHFCYELLQHLRNLILMKVSEHPEGLVELPQEELESLKKQSGRFRFEQLNHLFNLLIRGSEEISQAAFPRTMLEMTLIRMAELSSVIPIEEILRRLEELQMGQPSGGPKKEENPPPRKSPLGSGGPPKEAEAAVKPQKRPAAAVEIPQGNADPEEEDDPGEWEDEEASSVSSETPVQTEAVRPKEPDPQRAREELKRGKNGNLGQETWRGLLDFTRARNPILGSFLALGVLSDLSEEKIEIGFEKDSFHYERMFEKENRSQLERICADYFKKEIKVLISSFGGEPKANGQRNSRGTDEILVPEQRRSENGSEQSPLVQEILRLFDGRIVG